MSVGGRGEAPLESYQVKRAIIYILCSMINKSKSEVNIQHSHPHDLCMSRRRNWSRTWMEEADISDLGDWTYDQPDGKLLFYHSSKDACTLPAKWALRGFPHQAGLTALPFWTPWTERTVHLLAPKHRGRAREDPTTATTVILLDSTFFIHYASDIRTLPQQRSGGCHPWMLSAA